MEKAREWLKRGARDGWVVCRRHGFQRGVATARHPMPHTFHECEVCVMLSSGDIEPRIVRGRLVWPCTSCGDDEARWDDVAEGKRWECSNCCHRIEYGEFRGGLTMCSDGKEGALTTAQCGQLGPVGI